MLFGEKILDYWDDILKDLATVVAIPSVAKPPGGRASLLGTSAPGPWTRWWRWRKAMA